MNLKNKKQQNEKVGFQQKMLQPKQMNQANGRLLDSFNTTTTQQHNSMNDWMYT